MPRLECLQRGCRTFEVPEDPGPGLLAGRETFATQEFFLAPRRSPRSRRRGLSFDEPEPGHGLSVSLAKKAAAASRSRPPGAATCFRARARATAFAPRSSASPALTTVGLVLTQPVPQRLLRTPARPRVASCPHSRSQHPHRLDPELRRVRRSRPRHPSAPLPGRLARKHHGVNGRGSIHADLAERAGKRIRDAELRSFHFHGG
jgi:hypothetical protein